MGVRSLAARVALSGVAVGCTSTAEPRPQLVVIVDTDAPTQSQATAQLELSGDAVVDTLRVDAIPLEGAAVPYDLRTFVAPAAEDWPISFGVLGTHEGRSVRLRLRAFRGSLGVPGKSGDTSTVDPPRGMTIERLVDLDLPAEGITYARVVLHGDCFGVTTTFGAAPTTCIDATERASTPRDGIEITDRAPLASSRVGTWASAREILCAGSPPAGALCIPGGFSALGDPVFQGSGGLRTSLDSVPLRPVRLRPYFMDRTELTVAELQALYAAGLDAPEPVQTGSTELLTHTEWCTWPGRGRPGNDTLPVNCITHALALAACQKRGGSLPTEAEWEHAARGRGQHRLYPWGPSTPDCCMLSAGRQLDGSAACPSTGIEPVGSHASGACNGLGDVSRDGVVDLAGSLVETLLDYAQPFDADCWQRPGGGILIDPVCDQNAASLQYSSRGTSWGGSFAAAAAPYRYAEFSQSVYGGFRCVTPAEEAP